ncbi:MAG: hypothetical protein EA351_12835 [Gemmatimonadales bacterium]|nr:MAG: hypothetical protein EA351_12835 [Gemmatimonadales bacterium]
MKAFSLLALRISIALLVLLWGIDKIVDPDHAVRVSDNFYFGLLSVPALLAVLGGAQIVVAVMAMIGSFRKIIDPIILLINLGSLASVWRSIIDPWGWVLDGTNVLFFPSLIVAAGCLVLIAFQDEEVFVLDRRASSGNREPRPAS